MIDEIIGAIGDFIEFIIELFLDKSNKKCKIISFVFVLIILLIIGFGIYIVFFR